MIKNLAFSGCIAAAVTAGILVGCGGGGGGGGYGAIGNAGATASDAFFSVVSNLIAGGSTDDALPVPIDSIAVTTPEDTEPVPII